MENPFSTGSAIPSNIIIQIAQPQPQPAVQSTPTQRNTLRKSGDPFAVGRNKDKKKTLCSWKKQKTGIFQIIF